LRPIILPDLSALDGSRQGISPLSAGGTTVSEINCMGSSEFTIAIGMSMEGSAALLKERCKIDYTTLKGLSGLTDTDLFMELLSCLSGRQMPEKYKRQRRILIDGMRDAHFFYGGKRVCIALDPDLALQTSRWVDEMGAVVGTAVIPHQSQTAERVCAQAVVVGDLSSIEGEFDIVISNSHAEETANRLGIPLYQMGFPVYKILGGNSRIAVGYRGSLTVMNDVANLLMKSKEGMYVKEEVCE
jgi:nitrogenase molybdenum-iron protein alpha/beta subunit